MSSALSLLLSNVDSLIFGKSLVKVIGLNGIDLYTNESHSGKVTLTKLAIESGANITDHAALEPKILRLKGVVSNVSPVLPNLPIVGSLIGIRDNSRSAQAWASIETLKKAREPLTVVTTLGVYENMVIVDNNAPEINSETGTSLFFSIDFQEVFFANSETTSFTPAKLSGPATNKTAKVNGGERQSPEVNQSLLSKIFDG